MTPEDDFDLSELGAALDRATPPPDPALRAAHLRLAGEKFRRFHATEVMADPRAAPRRGAWAGIRGFLGSFAHPGAATATTAVAALALLMVTPAGQEILRGPLAMGEAYGGRPGEARPEDAPAEAPEAEAPAPEPSAATAPAEAPPASETARAAEARGGAVASTGLADAAADLAEPPPGGQAAGAMESATGPGMTAQAVAPEGERAEGLAASPLDGSVALAPPGASPGAGEVAAADVAPDASARSADAGAASFAAVRDALLAGVLPAPEAVEVQGLVDHLAPVPDAPVPDAPAAGGAALRSAVSVIPTPWDPSARLVVVTVRAAVPVEGAELELDGGAALGTGVAGGAVPLGALGAGGVAVRVLETGPGAGGGTLRLRWTDPATGQPREAKAPVTGEEPATPEARLAAAVAGWALLLREGAGRLGAWDHGDAAALAEASRSEGPAGLQAEAVDLMRRAEALAR